MTMPVHRKLHYISKCNKLVQLVVQVQFHMKVIYSFGGRHMHAHTSGLTTIVQKDNQFARNGRGSCFETNNQAM